MDPRRGQSRAMSPSLPATEAHRPRPRRIRRRPGSVLPLLVLMGLAAATLLLSACTVIWRTVETHPVATDGRVQTVASPVRAYLTDGAVVVFPMGASVTEGALSGRGVRYSLGLESEESVQGVPLDSVVAVEAFRQGHENVIPSALILAGSTVGAFLGTSLLFVAIFGSCPTIYGDVDGEAVLQAEPFSHSITQLFEARDVDRIGVSPDTDGILRLELRNEALETHYINHMELLQVVHAPDGEVLADPAGRPLLLHGVQAPVSARDRSGESVLAQVESADDDAFRSRRELLASATEEDFHDWVELEFPAFPSDDTPALILRARNTLLTSVLLYEVMLADSGLRSLDWLGRDLHRIGTAAELASWYRESMGLRILVDQGEGFREVAYLPDAGPIAWTERAVPIPHLPVGSRVRLVFPTDAWFIDRIALARRAEPAPVTRIPVTRARGMDGASDPSHLQSLAAPDEDYLVTFPGQRLHLEFDVPLEPDRADTPSRTQTRTLLLATQGYYVEWIRGEWVRRATDGSPFRPHDGAILDAMERWSRIMDDYERDFFESRLPVR